MPESASNTSLALKSNDFQLQVKEFDAAGKSTEFAMAVPDNVTALDISVKLRTFLLKKTTMRACDLATILHAVLYADRMGLDIMAGDVYIVEGRIATTAAAKIRHAIASGKVEGYNVEITDGPVITISLKQGEWKGPNLRAKVTVYVKGWQHPVIYETTLQEWFVGSNPNWKSRPAYMLRRNALSKALEEVAPMGVEPDEAPPAAPPNEVAAAAASAIAAATTRV